MKALKNIKIDHGFTAAPALIFALTVLFTSICYMLNIKSIVFSLPLAILIVVIIGIKYNRSVLISCVITVTLSVMAIIVAGHIYDVSYDGMSFHKEAVYALANGWNPWRISFYYFNYFGKIQDTALWLDNYPKGAWSFYACVYSLTGRIEQAKGLNTVFVLMLFFSAYDTIATVFNKKGVTCFLLAAVFTANPVILSQFFTYMNDLPVAAFVMVCAFLGMKIYDGKADRWDYVSLAAVFASSFAVKFTAPVFCGFVLLAYGVAFAIKNRGKEMLKPCAVVIGAALIGIFIMGADPYIKHIAEGKNPIYPVMGEGKYDIMNTNAPEGIEEMSNAQALLTSIFSQASENPEDAPKLKIPFSVAYKEIWNSSNPDVRLSGFGMFFSGILLISLGLGIFALLKAKKFLALVPTLIIFIMLALFFPESWWARYNPYIYYIPCLLLLAFSCADNTYNAVIVMCALMLINSGANGLLTMKNFYKQSKILKWKMSEIIKTDSHVLFAINDFPSHEIWFNEFEIDFELVKDFGGDDYEQFYKTTYYQLKEKENVK